MYSLYIWIVRFNEENHASHSRHFLVQFGNRRETNRDRKSDILVNETRNAQDTKKQYTQNEHLESVNQKTTQQQKGGNAKDRQRVSNKPIKNHQYVCK